MRKHVPRNGKRLSIPAALFHGVSAIYDCFRSIPDTKDLPSFYPAEVCRSNSCESVFPSGTSRRPLFTAGPRLFRGGANFVRRGARGWVNELRVSGNECLGSKKWRARVWVAIKGEFLERRWKFWIHGNVCFECLDFAFNDITSSMTY